jgi:cytochrome P450
MRNVEPLEISEAYLADPFPKLAEIREHDPVHWSPSLDTWIVTRFEDVRQIFADPRMSRDRKLSKLYTPAKPGSWAHRFDLESIATADLEEHRRLRKNIAAGFKPKAVARMEQQVRDVVEQFAAPLRGQTDRVDLVSAFTSPIPNTVIGRITGIPPYPGDEERFCDLAQDVIRRFVWFADSETQERGERALDELAEWVGKLADERRQQRQEDLVSDLIHTDEEATGITNDEIVMLVAGLVAAGSETTTLGATTALRLLFENPEQFDRLRANPKLALNAVHETLRFDFGAATGGIARFAIEDVPLRGKVIRKGDMVMLSSAAAHRDPERFPNPNQFDITREPGESLAFGHGAHYCIGSNLALQEMTFILEAALDVLPASTRLRSDEIEWETIGLLRRPSTLPVSFS